MLEFAPNVKAEAKEDQPEKTIVCAGGGEFSEPSIAPSAPPKIKGEMQSDGETLQEKSLAVGAVHLGDSPNTWAASWMYEVADIMTTCGDIACESSVSEAVSKCSEFPSLILDIGASRAVVGMDWIKRWFTLRDYQPNITLSPITRKFGFGSGQVFQSIGTIMLHGMAIRSKGCQ